MTPAPPPFNRISFVTLYRVQLFTVEQVADLIEQYIGDLPGGYDLCNVDIGDMVKEIDRRGMVCRIRDKPTEAHR